MDDAFLAGVAAHLDLTLKYARAAEKIHSTLLLSSLMLQQVKALHDIDEELAPELLAVIDGTTELNDALERAFKFITTRLEVSASNVFGSEGGTPS